MPNPNPPCIMAVSSLTEDHMDSLSLLADDYLGTGHTLTPEDYNRLTVPQVFLLYAMAHHAGDNRLTEILGDAISAWHQFQSPRF